jgi:DNA-binding MarR family transcriptional regulator
MPPDATRRKAARFDSAEQEAFLNLWRTYDRLRAIEDDVFTRFDLTSQQYNALRLLRAAFPESLPTLAIFDRLVSRAPDITRLLDKLEERGLVRRERPPHDRRTVLIAITDAGLDLLVEIAGPLQECHEKQLGHLSAADLKKLTTLLRAAREPHEPDNSPWRK